MHVFILKAGKAGMFAYSFGALLFRAIPGFWEIAKAESERPLPVILVPCVFVGKICTPLLVAVSWTLFVRQNEKTCVLNDFEIDNFKTLTRISCLAPLPCRKVGQLTSIPTQNLPNVSSGGRRDAGKRCRVCECQ